MIPNTKISATILEFGKAIISELPSDFSEAEFEAAITLVITAWNAVVMDSWENSDRYESELLSALKSAPKEAQVQMIRLIKRKKNKFSLDPRGVGNHWITEKNGDLVFGCDARLNVENAPTPGTIH